MWWKGARRGGVRRAARKARSRAPDRFDHSPERVGEERAGA
ncbi:hypothetical protein [Streptomyces sp. NPDC059072]